MKTKIFVLSIVAVIAAACSPYGKKQMVGKVELFVKSSLTTDEGDKIAAFLNEIGYNDAPVSVQADKDKDVYLLRFVVQKGKLDAPEVMSGMAVIRTEAAVKLFPGNKIRIDLCDEYFQTLKSL